MRTIATNSATRVCTGSVFGGPAYTHASVFVIFLFDYILILVLVLRCHISILCSLGFFLFHIWFSTRLATQAAYRNLPAMCEMLIRFGTDVNAQNRQGQTALHLVRLLCRFCVFCVDCFVALMMVAWLCFEFCVMWCLCLQFLVPIDIVTLFYLCICTCHAIRFHRFLLFLYKCVELLLMCFSHLSLSLHSLSVHRGFLCVVFRLPVCLADDERRRRTHGDLRVSDQQGRA